MYIYDALLGNRLVETHGNNLPLQSNSSMEPSKSIDSAGSSESISNDRSRIAEIENQIGTATKSRVTFKDLQEAISKLVTALNRKPVPDLDNLNLKDIRLHEKEKEDSLDVSYQIYIFIYLYFFLILSSFFNYLFFSFLKLISYKAYLFFLYRLKNLLKVIWRKMCK